MRETATAGTNLHIERRNGLRLRCAAQRGEAGQSFVELALIAPIFFSLILGVAEFGRLAYAGIEVNNAARAGVAYGAQSITTASDSNGIENAATSDGSDFPGRLTVTQSKVLCSCSGPPGTEFNYLTVQTQLTVTPFFHYPGLPASFTLNGLAIMRVGQ